MAVRRRGELLSAEGDPARVTEVTQPMTQQFEKAQQHLGVSVQMLMVMAVRLLFGLQSSRQDQARKRLRRSQDDVMIVPKRGTCDKTT